MWVISFKELESIAIWKIANTKILYQSTSTELLACLSSNWRLPLSTELPNSLTCLWITPTWVNCFCSWVTELRKQLKASTGSCSNDNKHKCWMGHSTLWGRLKTCNLLFVTVKFVFNYVGFFFLSFKNYSLYKWTRVKSELVGLWYNVYTINTDDMQGRGFFT